MRRIFKVDSKQVQCYAAMGAAVCLGFFIFGFFETMFRDMRTMSFYVVLLGVFWVLSANTKDPKYK